MSFQQGLSGLSASSKSLEAIGNNVANANTIGFKQSQAVFSDVYAASLSGTGASQIGIGTQLTEVVQQFTQGNVTASNNALAFGEVISVSTGSGGAKLNLTGHTGPVSMNDVRQIL